MTSSIAELGNLLTTQRSAYRDDPLPSAAERIGRLKALKAMLQDNREALLKAMSADFSARSHQEMLITELVTVIQSINYMCRRVKGWMKPQRRHLPFYLQPGRAEVHYQPLGVVGIIVPFNYPLMLSCSPLATALVAGNRAMLKMPEATPQTSALLAEVIEAYFPSELVAVVTGELEVSIAFSKLPFDHLVFTGSATAGRQVMRSAADNLTPVTLELGGKSPAIIDSDFDIAEAARRICFGKSINAGQTCIAPDYVLVPKPALDPFVSAYRSAFQDFYPTLAGNPDYTALISDRHARRLDRLIIDAIERGARVERLGADPIADGTRRYAPALLLGVDDRMQVMQEEIFGPLLPILTYENLDQALAYINHHPRPLALYYFGLDRHRHRRVIEDTHSGGVTINEVMLHVAVDDLPFGGIGPSGMGHYHGREGFQTLSKAKSVLVKPRFFNTARVFYPPYGGRLGRLVLDYLLR